MQCVAFGVPSDKTIQPKDADAPMHSSREGSFTTLTSTFDFSLEISEMFVWYRKIIKFMSICRDYATKPPSRFLPLLCSSSLFAFASEDFSREGYLCADIAPLVFVTVAMTRPFRAAFLLRGWFLFFPRKVLILSFMW